MSAVPGHSTHIIRMDENTRFDVLGTDDPNQTPWLYIRSGFHTYSLIMTAEQYAELYDRVWLILHLASCREEGEDADPEALRKIEEFRSLARKAASGSKPA